MFPYYITFLDFLRNFYFVVINANFSMATLRYVCGITQTQAKQNVTDFISAVQIINETLLFCFPHQATFIFFLLNR